jgi:histidinol dehydrogenase
MPLRLDAADADFRERFLALLATKRETPADVTEVVRAIIADVRERGDDALIEYTKRFDEHDLTAATLRVSREEIEAARASAPMQLLNALTLARDRIEDYHRRQLPADVSYVDEIGVELGWRWTAIESVGLYVPGGTASYPSSVLMNAVPAKVAGVDRVVMVVPSPGGKLNSLVLAAASLAGVDEIYRIGGAQAVAALAYGTATIPPVVKIVGPGNMYVAEAKRQVFGLVGIDMIAGPSEVLVVADAGNDPEWIAADLLAQAEHDPNVQAILVTDDRAFGDSVAGAVNRQLATLQRADIARESWEKFGAIILVRRIEDSPALINRIAPEHLQLAIAKPRELLPRIRNAGAIFLGRHSPEAIGDYVGGPNHVLPTSGAARFSSGLSVLDFMKRSSLLGLGADSLRQLGPAAVILAEAEGLQAHGRSISVRLSP